MTTCKNFFKILTVVLALLDVGVGWYKFYELYHESGHLAEEIDSANSVLQNDCHNPQLYWKIYVVFQAIGTILAGFEIYYLIREVKKDKRMFEECFGRAWCLIVAIYLFAVFPSTIVDILYLDKCVCADGFSFSEWRAEVRDFFKGFLDGVSVILLQIILHLTEGYVMVRKLGRFIGTCLYCVKYAPKIEAAELPWKKRWAFRVGIILAICYAALFVTEILFIFCVKHK